MTGHTFPVISNMTESIKHGLHDPLTPFTIKSAGGVVLQNTLDQFLDTRLPGKAKPKQKKDELHFGLTVYTRLNAVGQNAYRLNANQISPPQGWKDKVYLPVGWNMLNCKFPEPKINQDPTAGLITKGEMRTKNRTCTILYLDLGAFLNSVYQLNALSATI